MSATIKSDAKQQALPGAAGKYLTFSLADEVYGLGVLKVREIIKMVAITQVPQVPTHVKGVVNLRGKIIPVVDLRAKFGMPAVEVTNRTCIIVVQIATGPGTTTVMGLVVDSVEEVLNLNAGEIEPPPDFGAAVETSFLVGMGKVKNKVVSLLDIDRVLAGVAT